MGDVIKNPVRNPDGINACAKWLALFYCFNYLFECLRVVHSEVSQNLAVEAYILSFEFSHKFRIGHTVAAGGCVDTLYPQAAEFPLLVFAAYIGVGQTFLYSVFGDCPNVSP